MISQRKKKKKKRGGEDFEKQSEVLSKDNSETPVVVMMSPIRQKEAKVHQKIPWKLTGSSQVCVCVCVHCCFYIFFSFR